MELSSMLKIRDALKIIIDICEQEEKDSILVQMFTAMLNHMVKSIEIEVERESV